jgi:hypothetical protein
MNKYRDQGIPLYNDMQIDMATKVPILEMIVGMDVCIINEYETIINAIHF